MPFGLGVGVASFITHPYPQNLTPPNHHLLVVQCPVCLRIHRTSLSVPAAPTLRVRRAVLAAAITSAAMSNTYIRRYPGATSILDLGLFSA